MINRESQHSTSLPRRLAWFILLWASGVLVVAGLAWLIRLVLS